MEWERLYRYKGYFLLLPIHGETPIMILESLQQFGIHHIFLKISHETINSRYFHSI